MRLHAFAELLQPGDLWIRGARLIRNNGGKSGTSGEKCLKREGAVRDAIWLPRARRDGVGAASVVEQLRALTWHVLFNALWRYHSATILG
jgi:hypothetical protein